MPLTCTESVQLTLRRTPFRVQQHLCQHLRSTCPRPPTNALAITDDSHRLALLSTSAFFRGEQCAELLDVDLATVRELAADIEPYIRSDGTEVWSLMQLERQLRPEAYRRRRGGYIDRRRTQTTDA
jgi:hypothetical protein